MASHSELSHSLLFPFLLLLLLSITTQSKPLSFSNIREATVNDLQLAFHRIHLTSGKLIELYIQQIHKLNHILKGVLELNPDALAQADRADQERRCAGRRPLPKLHGITILVKDNIATKDQMNTTAGGNSLPSGWSARGGQGKNPYTRGDPCGSSSGSGISVAANLVAVSLGTETFGSILCSSTYNSVVGIKPTIDLTSRDRVVPISQRL
ncbi:hypothetical protein K1719_014177 [Acacia pycnantha]|nr:hypothetical protein K1719_014177 [Acacia pycnantha]